MPAEHLAIDGVCLGGVVALQVDGGELQLQGDAGLSAGRNLQLHGALQQALGDVRTGSPADRSHPASKGNPDRRARPRMLPAASSPRRRWRRCPDSSGDAHSPGPSTRRDCCRLPEGSVVHGRSLVEAMRFHENAGVLQASVCLEIACRYPGTAKRAPATRRAAHRPSVPGPCRWWPGFADNRDRVPAKPSRWRGKRFKVASALSVWPSRA